MTRDFANCLKRWIGRIKQQTEFFGLIRQAINVSMGDHIYEDHD